MYTPRQIWRHVTPRAQLLIALSFATVLAFSAGLASGIYGRTTAPLAQTTNRMPITAVVAPRPQAQPYLLGGHGELVAGASNTQATSRITSGSLAPIGAGSAYDGRSYRSLQTAPNVPVIGTGSVYEGGQYGAAPQRSSDARVFGSGSAYDGGQYGSPVSAPRTSPNVMVSGTGSAYDGQADGSLHPVVVVAQNAPIQTTDPALQSIMNYIHAHDGDRAIRTPLTRLDSVQRGSGPR